MVLLFLDSGGIYAGSTNLRIAYTFGVEPGGVIQETECVQTDGFQLENENIQPSVEMLVRLSRLFGVTTDYLLGLENTPRLNVDGLPQKVVAHLSLLIEDYRGK